MGGTRPLGNAALTDKIVQKAVVEIILTPIYERELLGLSYGFRPGRGAHNAHDALADGIHRRNVNWVVDSDIRACFDSVSRDWLVRFLEHRIADRRVVRYADDFVAGFQRKEDAERFLREARERFARFDLELHPDKTRLVEFGRYAKAGRRKRGLGKPETFDFLGFTHYCATTRKGRFRVGRKPMAKRMNRTLKQIKEELHKRWRRPIGETAQWLGRVLNGWLNDYAAGSMQWLQRFKRHMERIWLNALRHRSQRDRYAWGRLQRIVALFWPRPTIRHPWPSQRLAVK